MSFSTMCAGVGPSGLPMLKSITSSPCRRAASLSSPVTLKTYGGRRWMRGNSSILAIILSLTPANQQLMKLHLTRPAGRNMFTGYGDGYVAVNDQRYERALVVAPDEPVADWEV